MYDPGTNNGELTGNTIENPPGFNPAYQFSLVYTAITVTDAANVAGEDRAFNIRNNKISGVTFGLYIQQQGTSANSVTGLAISNNLIAGPFQNQGSVPIYWYYMYLVNNALFLQVPSNWCGRMAQQSLRHMHMHMHAWVCADFVHAMATL